MDEFGARHAALSLALNDRYGGDLDAVMGRAARYVAAILGSPNGETQDADQTEPALPWPADWVEQTVDRIGRAGMIAAGADLSRMARMIRFAAALPKCGPIKL